MTMTFQTQMKTKMANALPTRNDISQFLSQYYCIRQFSSAKELDVRFTGLTLQSCHLIKNEQLQTVARFVSVTLLHDDDKG